MRQKIKPQVTALPRIYFISVVALLIFAVSGLLQVVGSSSTEATQTVPYRINYQGRISDNQGSILPDGSYNIRFRLFSVATGGSAIWTESRTNGDRVQVTNGLFNVQLGEVTALPPGTFATYPLFLEVELPTPATATTTGPVWDEGPFTPRQRLASAPYAFNADQLDGYTSSEFARLGENANFTANLQQNGNAVCTVAGNCSGVGGVGDVLQGGNAFGTLMTLGTTDNHALRFITNNAEAMRILTNGNVGIGLTGPDYKLDVSGGTGIVARFSGRVIGADAVEDNEFVTKGQLDGSGAGTCEDCVSLQATTPGTAQSGNLNISGTGIFGTSVLAAALDSASATSISIGTSNATSINLNQNTTLAANKSLTVTGGTTANRPTSPTEGMIWFDTDTKQILVYSNGKWQADRSTATKIVAASDSSQVAKDSADYVASGTADQVEINAALTAAAGGKVYLMKGTYYADDTISIPDNTTLAGAGKSTVIRVNTKEDNIDLITNSNTSTGTGVTIRDVKLDGARDFDTTSIQRGIYLNNMGGGTGSNSRPGARIVNVEISNFINRAVFLHNSSNSNITDNVITNSHTGLHFINSNYNNIKGNIISGADINAGIRVNSSSYNTLTGNVVKDGGSVGIVLHLGASHNTLSSNVVKNNTANGIRIMGSSFSNSVVGNQIEGNTVNGIWVTSSSSNLISGNRIHDNGGNDSDNNGIYVSTVEPDPDPDYNSIIGNYITDTEGGGYAIKIEDGEGNYLSANRFGVGSEGIWNVSGPIYDSGTATVYDNQLSGSNGLDFVNRTANSTTAFQVQNASGTALLNADTTNMRIGIGTAIPDYALDVVTSDTIAGRFSGRVIGVDAVEDDEFVTLGQANSLIGGATANSILQGGNSFGATLTIGTTDNHDISFIANGNEAMRLLTDGSLRLSVYNCSTFDNGGLLTTDASGNVICANASDGSGGLEGSGTEGQVAFFNNLGEIQGTDSFFWDEGSERLGIGTNTPQATLDISGQSRIQGSDPNTITQIIQGAPEQSADLLSVRGNGIDALTVRTDEVFVLGGIDEAENWTEVTNNNISLPDLVGFAIFTSDDNVLVLMHQGGEGVTFIDSSDPDPANWTEITNNNISLLSDGGAATFTSDDNVLVLTYQGGDHVTFIDSSDPDPANWTEITNNNISLSVTGIAATFTSDDNVLVIGLIEGGDSVTFIDSSDPDPANWTEITNNNISLSGAGYDVTFTSDDNVLVLAYFDPPMAGSVILVDSSDPDPANWTEITNNNISLSDISIAATFTSDDNVLVVGHFFGDHITFIDSSDPNPANWTEVTNNNISLPDFGFIPVFTSDDNVLVVGHAGGDGVTFIDSSNPNPANWTEVTNSNISLPGTGFAATFSNDNSVLVLGHEGGDYVTFVDTTEHGGAIVATPRIGIGTATPSYALDVVATNAIAARFSGRVIGADGVNANEFVTKSQLDAVAGSVGGAYSQRIRIHPEYPNTVLRGDGSNNIGLLTASYSSAARQNYYRWTTDQSTNQDYDIVMQVPIPTGFTGWDGTNPIRISTYTSNTTNGTISFTLIDSSGTTRINAASVTPSTVGTWQSINPGALTTGTYTPGDYITIILKVQSGQNGDTRVGNIYLDYIGN